MAETNPEVGSSQISRNEFDMGTFDLTSFVSKPQGCVSIFTCNADFSTVKKTTSIKFPTNNT
jgi:hypothetical protein